jgi:hypothetical protein
VNELSEENNCLTNRLWPEPAWTEFISDPAGDQSYGYGPDVVGADFNRDETTVYLRVRTAEPIEPYDTVNYMLLDLDRNASTGFVSYDAYLPTNDIGADAAALILPDWIMVEELSLPLRITGDGRQLETEPVQALSGGLVGWLLLWDPYYEGFYYVDEFPAFTDTDYFWFAISLDMLEDDGIMDVVDVIGGLSEPTDVAPDEGHGNTRTSQRMGCFIATAAYGTPMAEEIQILRQFRDEYLLTNALGQALIELYYRISPPMAEFITEHPSLKPIARAVLVPAVAVSTMAVNTTAAQKAATVGLVVLVLVGVAIWVSRRRDRGAV